MAAVWYIGKSDRRVISTQDWAAQAISAGTVTWDLNNGFSIPKTSFTAAQITLLDRSGEFNTNAADGPNVAKVAATGIDAVDPFPQYLEYGDLANYVGAITGVMVQDNGDDVTITTQAGSPFTLTEDATGVSISLSGTTKTFPSKSSVADYFIPEEYGSCPDGGDCTAALQACRTAALAAGGTMFLSAKTYGLTNELQMLGIDRAITLVGEGSGKSVIKALNAAARVTWGQRPTGSGTTGLTLYGRPGLSHGWSFDGNLIATQGVEIGGLTGYGTWMNIDVLKCNGNGWTVHPQNCLFLMCNAQNNAGNGWTLDYGIQSCQFINIFAAANDGWQIEIRQSGGYGWGLSAQPQGIGFLNGIVEQGGAPSFANGNGLGGVHIREGLDITFERFDIVDYADTSPVVHSLVLTPATPGPQNGYVGRVVVRDCRIQRIYLNANSGGVAQSMGGTNEPLALEGWNTIFGSIINGSTAPVYDNAVRNTVAGALTYTPEGTGAYPALVPVKRGMIGTRLKFSVNQALAGAYTVTNPTWNTEVYDTHGFHTGSSASVVIPVGCAGYYSIKTLISTVTSVNASETYVKILVNGNGETVDVKVGDGSHGHVFNQTTDLFLNVGDTVQVWIMPQSAITLQASDCFLTLTKTAS
jgi:hypothetical protein